MVSRDEHYDDDITFKVCWKLKGLSFRNSYDAIDSTLALNQFEVEKILKGSMDSILSPSLKNQIMNGKVCLWCKGKTLLGVEKC